ncbi:MAG: TolB family protein [Chloroflexota bacterium]
MKLLSRILTVTLISILLTFLTLSATPATAQAGLPVTAYVDAEGLAVYIPGQGVVHRIAGTPTQFNNLRFDANGSRLLYTRYVNGGQAVHLLDVGSGSQQTLTENAAFLPPAFGRDGAVYYTEMNNSEITESPTGPQLGVTIFRFDIGSAQPVGEVGVGVGCGGGSPFPMDAAYNIEAGFGGRALTFTDTASGMLYSLNCAGVGLGLVDLETGEIRILSEAISRVTLAPDEARIAGVDERSGQLTVIDLRDGAASTLGNAHPVDQLTWSSDGGAVFYSSRELLPDPLPLSEDEAAAVARTLGLPADGIPQYNVRIQRISTGGGESTIFSEPAWAVGRMYSRGGALYFSLISNGEAWVEALASGEIDPLAADSFAQAWQSVVITLLTMPGSGGDVTEIGRNMYLFRLVPA